MNRLKFITVAAVAFVVGILVNRVKEKSERCNLCDLQSTLQIEDPPCLQMYFNIEKFAKKYNIPRRFAYGIAYEETRYEGPFDWDYKHAQTSYAGALGPMQIMPTTADMMWRGKRISRDKLKNDIPLNVETSMKLLRKLHDRYGDWEVVFGYYNTGRPMVNRYAQNVYNHRIDW